MEKKFKMVTFFFKQKFKMIFMFENGWDLDEKSFDAFVEETI